MTRILSTGEPLTLGAVTLFVQRVRESIKLQQVRPCTPLMQAVTTILTIMKGFLKHCGAMVVRW